MKLSQYICLATSVLAAGVRGDCDETNKAYSKNDTERHLYNKARTLRLGWVIGYSILSIEGIANPVKVTFEGYAPLDLWGPLQILTGVLILSSGITISKSHTNKSRSQRGTI